MLRIKILSHYQKSTPSVFFLILLAAWYHDKNKCKTDSLGGSSTASNSWLIVMEDTAHVLTLGVFWEDAQLLLSSSEQGMFHPGE